MKHKIWYVTVIAVLFLLSSAVGATMAAESEPPRDVNLVKASSLAPRVPLTYTTVVTVNTTADTSSDAQTATCYYDGGIYFSTASCSFRRALVEAEALPSASRPVLIAFDIPTTDPNYNKEVSGTWTLMVDAALPALTTEYLVDRNNGLTTIDGATQPGGRTDGPKIIIDSGDTSLEVESGRNTIRNIAWKGGGAIWLKKVSGAGGNNVVENIWRGLSDDGQEIAFRDPDDETRLAVGGIVVSQSDGNIIRNNVIAGAYSPAVGIDGGDDNIVQDNFIGTRSDGTVPDVSEAIKCARSETYASTSWYGGWGIALSGSQNQIISNTIAGLHQMQTENETPPIALDIYGSDHLIQYNVIGRDSAGSDIGVCGQGIKAAGDSTEILDNTIVDSKPGFTDASNNTPTKGAIYVNDSSPTFDQITIRRNVVITSPEEVIEFGPGIPDALRLFEPAQISVIDGTTVEGTSGDASPCPGCLIDLYLDDQNDNQEALEWLGSAIADASGNFTATLPRALTGAEGIRTSSTSQDYFVIGDYGLGVTTDLSDLYVPSSSGVAPTVVAIAAADTGYINTPYSITVAVFPLSVTLPITYAIYTDGGTPNPPATSLNQRIVQPDVGFTWSTAGTKTLVITATNESGFITGTHSIFITDTVPSAVAPTTLTITGPITGYAGELYNFLITVDPEDVTTPILYVLDATDLAEPISGLLNQRRVPLRNRSWDTTGTKIITVTAVNKTKVVVSSTHTIVITDIAPAAIAPLTVTVNGPATGETGTPYTFTATVDPTNVTTPITYEIQYTDGSAPLGPFSSSQRVIDTSVITWTTPGTKTVWIQATNGAGFTIGTHEIVIEEAPPEPQASVILTGPATGETNTPYTFTATISPTTATKPITYTFERTDGTGPTSSGPVDWNSTNLSNVTWGTPGTKVITVTAQNADGVYTDTHTIVISEEPVGPEAHVMLTGPITGVTNTPYTFTATISPTTATKPITYTFERTDGTDPVSSGPVNANSADLPNVLWDTSGTKAITVTAQNADGTYTDTHTIVISTKPVEPKTGVFTMSVSGGTQTFTATGGVRTTIQIPSGALSETTTFTYTLIASTIPYPLTSGFGYAGRSFELVASSPLSGQITVTLEYLDQDWIGAGIDDENTLRLYYWDGNTWDNVANACGPPIPTYAPDTDNNLLAAPICHLSYFALLGKTGQPIVYLPLILRRP